MQRPWPPAVGGAVTGSAVTASAYNGTSFSAKRARRVSVGGLMPLVFALLAAVFAYEALQDRSATTEIVVARTAVPVGQGLGPGDTKTVIVHSSDVTSTRGLLAPGQLTGRWFASVDLEPGEPLTVAEVTASSQSWGLSEMSIPVPQDQAVGGGLAAGDLVDVIEVPGGGQARYVARRLRVLSVASTGSGGVLGAAPSGYFVVVAVDRKTALQLASALSTTGGAGGDTSVDVLRSGGAQS